MWDSVREEKNCYGLVPFENSSGGVVWSHLDQLCREPVSIIGEVNLQVRMCVGGMKNANLHEVQHVYSHQKGLDQCRGYLRTLERLEHEHATESTVAAVRTVAESGDPQSIALASRSAIVAAGLPVLRQDIADRPAEENTTQFFLIRQNGNKELPQPEARHHAVILTPHDYPGVLRDILNVIASARVDLHSLQSRGRGRKNGNKRYSFFLEMERQGTAGEFAWMQQGFRTSRCGDGTPLVESTEWLGSWDYRVEG